MRVFTSGLAILAAAFTLSNGRVFNSPNRLPVLEEFDLTKTIERPPRYKSPLVPRKDWPEDAPGAASEEEAQRAACKGTLLMAAMITDETRAGRLFSPPRDSSQSEFTHFPDDFSRWGWTASDTTERDCFSVDQLGIGDAMRDITPNPMPRHRGGTVSCLSVVHADPDDDDWEGIDEQIYEVDGNEYRMTGGTFQLAIEPVSGVLAGLARYGAAHMGKLREPPVEGSEELPHLRAASDIMWGAYRLASGINDIRWFLAVSIENDETLAIMKFVLDKAQTDIQRWPGLYVRTDTEEGKMLMGTPNAKGFGYLLAQRKAELGRKYISAVRIFHGSPLSAQPCLAFQVANVPPNVGIPDVPGDPGIGELIEPP